MASFVVDTDDSVLGGNVLESRESNFFTTKIEDKCMHHRPNRIHNSDQIVKCLQQRFISFHG